MPLKLAPIQKPMFRTRATKIAVAVLFFSLIGGYAYSTTRDFIHGPEITLEAPTDGLIVSDDHLTVAGTAARIAKLYLNGRQIFTSENGRFSESVILQSGYNLIELWAEDKFGRQTKITRTLVLK